MPIVHYARTEAEARAVPGASNVRKRADDGSGELWLCDTHVGLCLSSYEHNGYDDSDFYMRVWNMEKGAPESVLYATTRAWTYPCFASAPDATPEVRTLYAMWCDKMRAEEERERKAREAAEPRKGKLIRVVRGRKIPHGTTGVCFWRGEGKAFTWSQARWGAPERVGFKDVNGTTFWTNLSNVEVVMPEAEAA